MAKLKVYRTAIGFHDAYVAAPSQKAALAAWGIDKDLFARGAAEVVTDPMLTADPLAAPGTVVKRLRGSLADNLAALPTRAPAQAKRRARPEKQSAGKPDRSPPKPRSPRPNRAPLDAAEAALGDARTRHEAALATVMEREAALARERRELEAAQRRETADLVKRREMAEARYRRALDAWQGEA